MLSNLWRRLNGGVVGVPGVVYSEDIDIDRELEKFESKRWLGELRNVRKETAPEGFLTLGDVAKETKVGPEVEPYTFWERVGLVPVHPSRVRARQYYHPVTDFGLFDYDELSPEEKELTVKWMARVMEFNGAIPGGILCAAGCLVLPLPTHFRMPLLVAAGITGVAVEVTRSYMAAFRQRQDLDDFILAKEIWYIKNVETYQLGIPRIPRGREKEYQDYVDGDVQNEALPQELLDALHF